MHQESICVCMCMCVCVCVRLHTEVTPQEVHDLAQEMDRLRAAISEAKKEQETATLRVSTGPTHIDARAQAL